MRASMKRTDTKPRYPLTLPREFNRRSYRVINCLVARESLEYYVCLPCQTYAVRAPFATTIRYQPRHRRERILLRFLIPPVSPLVDRKADWKKRCTQPRMARTDRRRLPRVEVSATRSRFSRSDDGRAESLRRESTFAEYRVQCRVGKPVYRRSS